MTNSSDRLLSILDLFTEERPLWTVEQAVCVLGVSLPTGYRYFKSLRKAGLVEPLTDGAYRLGSAFIEFDRRIRASDPLLHLARRPMLSLVEAAGEGCVALLCRLYREKVMCVAEEKGPGPQLPVSYERGLPMPLWRGATSRIILAHLSSRTLRRIYAAHEREVFDAGLGKSWRTFLGQMRHLRAQGVSVTEGQLDAGRVGVAAPIRALEGGVVASLSIVINSRSADACKVEDLKSRVVEQAAALADALAENDRISLASPRIGTLEKVK